MTRPAHEPSPDHRNLGRDCFCDLWDPSRCQAGHGCGVVACAVAVGGGTLRDLFLDRHALFWILNPHYPLIVLALRLSLCAACALAGALVYLGRPSTGMDCPHHDGNRIDGGGGLPPRRSSLEVIVSQPSCPIGPSLSLGVSALGPWRPRGGRLLHREGPILGVEERKDRPRNVKAGRWLRSWSSPC
jgi:hypothetical protein